MSLAVEAVYENGGLKLSKPLALPEHARVLVRIEEVEPAGPDRERNAWLKLSEESLSRAWDNPEDDAFDALLDK